MSASNAATPLREDTHGVIPYTCAVERKIVPMYDRETYLSALLETQEGGIPPELETEFQRDVQESLAVAKDGRDSVAWTLTRMMVESAKAKAEIAVLRESQIERLSARSSRFEKAADRLKGYVLDVILRLPRTPKGEFQKLEGNTSLLKAAKVAPSVEVVDEAVVPLAHKRVNVTMPAEAWRRLVEAAGSYASREMADCQVNYEVTRTSLLAALKVKVMCPECCGVFEACERCENTGQVTAAVPGARLVTGKVRLVVE